MPNKPHAPRKPAKNSASSNQNSIQEDSSFIIFGNDTAKKKGKANKGDDASSDLKKGGPSQTETKAINDAKRAETRTVISGSSSWTGKLPLNLFNEHCQKSKWEKPEYTMTSVKTTLSSNPPTSPSTPSDNPPAPTDEKEDEKSDRGFISTVILRYKNPKTGLITSLPPISVPREHREMSIKPSAVEARHFAACYALFRVCNAKNLSMALPPQYRSFWKGEFSDIKKEEEGKGRGWLFEAEPFVAFTRHGMEKEEKEKERLEREKRREKQKLDREDGTNGPSGKGWGRAVRVDMGRKMRGEVEKLVREGTRWNVHDVEIDEKKKSELIREIVELGFRKSHVEEAVGYCRDKEEALEWLIIHVPEDDLPKWCLPEKYSAGVSLASADFVKENKIKRLASAGYSTDVCQEILTDVGDDEALAAEELQNRLLGRKSVQQPTTNVTDTSWSEEQDVTESVFGEKYQKSTNGDSCTIKLDTTIEMSVTIRKPASGYPDNLPILALEAKLPSYIRLSIIKACLIQGLADHLGEQMIYTCVDWIEQNYQNIIDNPGTLANISAAVGLNESSESPPTRKARKLQTRMPIRKNVKSDQQSLQQWTARQDTEQQKKMLLARQGLPAWQLRDEIVRCVKTTKVTIISGETGSGKSTQAVQFILDDLIQNNSASTVNIICTQPRRISALGLADRVADERCGIVGQEVGYSIKGDSKQSPGMTKITFVTTGVLLRRLQSSDNVLEALADVSHVVIDEVHERTLDTDFLMTLLRDVLEQREDLRLVLMSATLDANLFETYFSGLFAVSKVQIAGRTYPVTDVYLEEILKVTGYVNNNTDEEDDTSDMGAAIRSIGTRINYDLIVNTVEYIDHKLSLEGDTGAILIFLPGVVEIDRTINALRRSSTTYHTLPLHASLIPIEQRRVFGRAEKGKRKIVCATNVAETSITIEDVVAVIDTGRVKETMFDPTVGMVKLEETWASKAACKQRRGRAGRVKAGTCYKLFTRNLEQTRMADRAEPEINRVPLEQLCLSVRAMGIDDVRTFLGNAITPPNTLAIDQAIQILHRMGILDNDLLTSLGRHLSLFPTDLRCGKLLVLGATFGCLDNCLTIASILGSKSPFISPSDKREEAKAARLQFSDGSGDLLCDLRAYKEWSDVAYDKRQWCKANFLSYQTLQDITTTKRQYLSQLIESGLVTSDYQKNSSSAYLDSQNDNMTLLRALLAASFSPQIARVDFPDTKYVASMAGTYAADPEAKTIKYFSESADKSVERVFIHPSSTLFSAQSFPTNTAFIAFFTKMATSKVFIRDLTPCNAFSILLFCGSLKVAAQVGGGIIVDDWIKIRGWARIGVLINRLRSMLDDLLAKKLDNPTYDIGQDKIVTTVRKMIDLNGMDV